MSAATDRTTCTAAVAVAEPGGAWRLIGGGVCVRIAGQPFLLSAGDVLATVTQRAYLGVGGRTMPLPGAAVLGGGPGAPPEARSLNIGFAPLMAVDLASPEALACITLEALDLDDAPPSEAYAAIAVRDAAATAWTVLPARGAPQAAYRSCGVDPATHLIVDADSPPSEATGLRGAGVWRRGCDATGDVLTGIVVASRAVEGGRATRIVATRAPFPVLGILGFLGVRPTGWPRARPVARSGRRTH